MSRPINDNDVMNHQESVADDPILLTNGNNGLDKTTGAARDDDNDIVSPLASPRVTAATNAAAAPDDNHIQEDLEDVEEEEEEEDHDDDDDDDIDEGGNDKEEQDESSSSKPLPKKRRIIVGEKADLYTHFETLNEKAYTKGGRDLGLYLCICKYCQQAHTRALAEWNQADPAVRGEAPAPPNPFPRTRRYCVNHQKQCPHIPKDSTAALLLQQQVQQAPTKQRTRVGATFSPSRNGTMTAHMPNLSQHTELLSSGNGILPSTFEVYVAKDTFKFNAAHFVAFEGYRERLHGHNYTVSVRLQGSRTFIGPDGYVIDYGNIKAVCKNVCKELNEHFLCPAYSDVLKITHRNQMVRLDCPMDGTYFEFPVEDCKFLPIVHATTEELAIYLWSVVMQQLDAPFLLQRGIQSMELTVAEAPGQQATFRHLVQVESLDVRAFIQKGPLVPQPCLDKPVAKKAAAMCGPNCPGCDGTTLSSSALQSLTNAMKEQGLLTRDLAVEDLQSLMEQYSQQ